MQETVCVLTKPHLAAAPREVFCRALFVMSLSNRAVAIAGIVPDRNDQSLDNAIIEPEDHVGQTAGEVRCRNRLDGLLSYCHRAA